MNGKQIFSSGPKCKQHIASGDEPVHESTHKFSWISSPTVHTRVTARYTL